MNVTFPSPEIELICGPQVTMGSSPLPYFDTTQLEKGVFHGNRFPAVPPGPTGDSDSYMNANYYDLGLCLYNLYYRTADPAHLALARKVVDSWWQFSPVDEGRTPIESSMSPRNSSVGGMMLRALDGRPEMWDWIARYTRHQFDSWVKRYLTEPALVNGVRDSSYMLLYATWLSQVHPDASLRASFRADAETATDNYFLRLQYPDGSWRWGDSYYTDADGGQLVGITQPFQVGLLLHALIDVYRVTTNADLKARLKASVLRAVDHLYDDGPYMKRTAGIPGSQIRWRGFHYLFHGGTTVNPAKYANGDYVWPSANAGNVYDVEGVRQATSTVIHAPGWAYSVTGDAKYAAMGDELLDSVFGFAEDQISNYVAGNDPKGYNQHYRAAGRYLAWRSGAVAPPPPPPPPVVQPTRIVLWPTGEAKQTAILNAQWVDGYRLERHISGVPKGMPKGNYVQFKKV